MASYWLLRIDKAKARRSLRVLFASQNAFHPERAITIHSMHEVQRLLFQQLLMEQEVSTLCFPWRRWHVTEKRQSLKLKELLEAWEEAVTNGWIKRLPIDDQQGEGTRERSPLQSSHLNSETKSTEQIHDSMGACSSYFTLTPPSGNLRGRFYFLRPELFQGRFYYDRDYLKRQGLPWMILAIGIYLISGVMLILDPRFFPYFLGAVSLSLFLAIEAYIKGFFD